MPYHHIAEIELFYRVDGSGDPLIIFPDNLLTSNAYEKEIAYFSDRYQVISFDYSCTGKSTHDIKYPDEREVDYWGFWADLACHLLLDLKIDNPIALGVGGGALTALHFAGKQAKQHKLGVKALILDSFLADWDCRKLNRWLDVREHFYVRNAKALEEMHGENWRNVADEDTRYLRMLADRGGYEVPDCFLNAISCPTMLTGHMQDHALPDIAQEYARISAIIPNSNIFLSATANHPYIERPFMWSDAKTFRLIVDSFLATQS